MLLRVVVFGLAFVVFGLSHPQIIADFHAQVRDAAARAGDAQERGEATPVSAVSQVLLLQPPAGAAHKGTHRGKAVQVLLLRPALQAAQPRAAAHATAHRSVPG